MMAKRKEKEKSLIELLGEKLDKRKAREVNLIQTELKTERPIILPISDVHLGSPECNEKYFMEVMEWAYDNKDVNLILNGDLLEASTRTSVGAGVYEQKQHAGSQLEKMLDILTPFADANRIIGITNGNHEDRIYQMSGVDITRLMANTLDVPYFKNGGFFKIKVGPHNYHMYFTHGASGALLPYTKIKKTYDLARFINVDLYGNGHVHDNQVHTQQYYSINNRSGQVEVQNRYFVITGHYLNWEGYAQMKSLVPSKQGTPKIKLHSDEKMIRVSL